tara:strand:+ start:478 stop:738 length:261 start_codon:yes stop_codon:yes gene_type:complete
MLFLTSIIKNKTRIIEKDISKLENKIANIKTNLYESQLDYYYLTSPKLLKSKLEFLSDADYVHMEFSKIYLDYNHFLKNQKNFTKK